MNFQFQGSTLKISEARIYSTTDRLRSSKAGYVAKNSCIKKQDEKQGFWSFIPRPSLICQAMYHSTDWNLRFLSHTTFWYQTGSYDSLLSFFHSFWPVSYRKCFWLFLELSPSKLPKISFLVYLLSLKFFSIFFHANNYTMKFPNSASTYRFSKITLCSTCFLDPC